MTEKDQTASNVASNDLSVTFDIDYRYEDFYPARIRKWSFDRRTFNGLILILLASVTIGGLLALADYHPVSGSETAYWIAVWSVPFAFIFTASVAIRRMKYQLARTRHKRRWEAAGGVKQIRLTLSAAGIVSESDVHRTEQFWAGFVSFEERADGFYLKRSSGNRTLIPTRCASPEQAEIIRELLRRHASPAKGFPITPVLKNDTPTP